MSPTLRLLISTMRGVSYSKRKLWIAPHNAMAAAGPGRAGREGREGRAAGTEPCPRAHSAPSRPPRAPAAPGPERIARGRGRHGLFHGCFHRITEPVGLESTSEIIEANQ